MHQILQDLNWRYATKKFDSTKKLSAEQLHVLMESMRLSASSYGLQPFKVLVIESESLREELLPASYNQKPVVESSHLFVFCAATKIEDQSVDDYMKRIADTRETKLADLNPFSNGVKASFKNKTQDEITAWTARQTYIALGQLLHSCASLRVDALPMEGFDPKEYNRILQLDEQHLAATLACPVGFRHEEDLSQHKKKVRKNTDEFFEVR